MSYILSIHLVLDIASQCHESLMKMCKHQTQIHSYTTVLNDPRVRVYRIQRNLSISDVSEVEMHALGVERCPQFRGILYRNNLDTNGAE